MNEIPLFISTNFITIWRKFLFRMADTIAEKTPYYLKESCVFALKGNYMNSKPLEKNLDGKIIYDKFQAIIFCFEEPTDSVLFIKDFSDSYSNNMSRNDNPFDIQTFTTEDPKKVAYFSSDIDYNTEDLDLITGWIITTKNGMILTDQNVKLIINSEFRPCSL